MLIGTFSVLSLVYFVAVVLYRVFVDPLRKIPGPRLNAITRAPYIRHLIKGTTVDFSVDLHKEYGDVVRLSPNEVSFTDESAWQDIYGFRTGKLKGHLSMQKVFHLDTRGRTLLTIVRIQCGILRLLTASIPFSLQTTRTTHVVDDYFPMRSVQKL